MNRRIDTAETVDRILDEYICWKSGLAEYLPPGEQHKLRDIITRALQEGEYVPASVARELLAALKTLLGD